MNDRLDALMNTLADRFKPIVQEIEKGVPTTKDHYGDYLGIIPKISAMMGNANNQNLCLAIGVSLQRAGASKDGVNSALRILGHI